MTKRAKVLMAIIVAVLAVGSLYLRSLARRIFFETSRSEEGARARLSEAALQADTGPKQTVRLYFPSYGEGKLLPEDREMAMAKTDVDRIRQIVLALAEGSRQGRGRALPPETLIRAAFLAPDGTAYVDLSNAGLSNFLPGIETETLAVYSIVDSLAASIPKVKKLKILVQGQEVDTLDGHADLTGYFVPDPGRISQTPSP